MKYSSIIFSGHNVFFPENIPENTSALQLYYCNMTSFISIIPLYMYIKNLVREYVFIVFTFHLVLVCFLFSFFSHFHEDITNLTEITCARRVAAGPGCVRVKIVISVTVTDSVYTGPSRLGVLSWAGRLRGAPLAVFADASV